MDLYGSHFELGGISSRQYSLIFANANTERLLTLLGSFESNSLYSKTEHRKYILKDNYSNSPVSFDAEIITDNGMGLELGTRKAVERWLFGNSSFRKLYIDTLDDCYGESYELIDGVQKRLYLNCRFTNPEKMEYNGGIVGYKCTVECDSCMAWQDPISKSFEIDENGSAGSIISIDVNSDLNDYIYPKVTINIGSSGGDITIVNESDDASRLTKFTNLSQNITFVMNGEINFISGGNYTKFLNKNFIRFLDGENKLAIIGDISSIEFEWQNRRYL